MEIFYKFKSFKNYKHIVDILVNERLHAASYRDLNDNLEGQFYSTVTGEFIKYRLNPVKEEHIHICSFSETYNNHLLWSHYADGHRGIAIGFTIDEKKYEISKVNYSGLLSLDVFPVRKDDVLNVFQRKIKEWEYEKERRIFLDQKGYIEVSIKEIIFGQETSKEDKEIITKLAKLVDSKIIIDTYHE